MPAAVDAFPDHEDRSRASRSGTGFKRAYKACSWCRKTKAKCERDESSPSCLKCQREGRECEFPAYRSTKRMKLHPAVSGFALLQESTDRARRTKLQTFQLLLVLWRRLSAMAGRNR